MSPVVAGRRRLKRTRAGPLPGLGEFVDVQADLLVLLTRLVLGAMVGALLHYEFVDAISLGAGAQAVLWQLLGKSFEGQQSDEETSGYEPRHGRTLGLGPGPGNPGESVQGT